MHLTATGLELICRPTAHNRDCELYAWWNVFHVTIFSWLPTPVTVIHRVSKKVAHYI